jgi:hypothetical protein
MKHALKFLTAIIFVFALSVPVLAEDCRANREVSKFMNGRCDWLYGVDTVPSSSTDQDSYVHLPRNIEKEDPSSSVDGFDGALNWFSDVTRKPQKPGTSMMNQARRNPSHRQVPVKGTLMNPRHDKAQKIGPGKRKDHLRSK